MLSLLKAFLLLLAGWLYLCHLRCCHCSRLSFSFWQVVFIFATLDVATAQDFPAASWQVGFIFATLDVVTAQGFPAASWQIGFIFATLDVVTTQDFPAASWQVGFIFATLDVVTAQGFPAASWQVGFIFASLDVTVQDFLLGWLCHYRHHCSCCCLLERSLMPCSQTHCLFLASLGISAVLY